MFEFYCEFHFLSNFANEQVLLKLLTRSGLNENVLL